MSEEIIVRIEMGIEIGEIGIEGTEEEVTEDIVGSRIIRMEGSQLGCDPFLCLYQERVQFEIFD